MGAQSRGALGELREAAHRLRRARRVHAGQVDRAGIAIILRLRRDHRRVAVPAKARRALRLQGANDLATPTDAGDGAAVADLRRAPATMSASRSPIESAP